MSIVEGRWRSESDTGDERRYPNYHAVEELDALVAGGDFDLVIVGGGGSGVVAAIEAADLGLRAIVLEKNEFPGGSTQASGGTIRLVADRVGAVDHLEHLAQGATPREVLEVFVAGLAEVRDWFSRNGVELEERADAITVHGRTFPISREGSSFPNFPHAAALGVRGLVPQQPSGRRTGPALWDVLSEFLAARNVPLVTGAAVTRLVTDPESRRVVGAEVITPSGPIVVRALHGVVLSCGGYAYDDELMTQYYGLPLPTVCPPGRATGDGVRMAIDVGADLWHMNAVAASVGYAPGELLAGIQAAMPGYGFVMVDQLARRYVCETELENHSAIFAMTAQDPITGEFVRSPSYLVFDEATRLAGSLSHMPHGENRHYPWSKDNSVEIERGWFHRASSLGELATEIGIAPEALSECVDHFNAAARGEQADPLGRTPAVMAEIAHPPFYAAQVYPIIVNTQGGPRRNAEGAIVRPDGSPIPGLFGAGELGSVWNRLYPGAGNICECIVSGRLAAQSAWRAGVAAPTNLPEPAEALPRA